MTRRALITGFRDGIQQPYDRYREHVAPQEWAWRDTGARGRLIDAIRSAVC